MKSSPFIFLCLFLFLFSCNKKKDIKEYFATAGESTELRADSATRVNIDARFDAETSLILLPRDEYKTYKDHYNYMPEEEYFKTNHLDYHLNDTITLGFSDNDEAQGLIDSLRLGMDWLCISIPLINQGESFVVNKAKTVSYSYNDVIEYIPITLLSAQDTENKDLACNIAFRGDYEKSDFKILEKKELSTDERKLVIEAIRKTIRKKDAIPPRPMSSDTLLLDNISKIANDIIIAKYIATRYDDSDGDNGNECIFVLQNGNVKKWFAGMNCTYNIFELRKQKYLYIGIGTYATGRVILFKLNDKIEEVYTNLIFGD